MKKVWQGSIQTIMDDLNLPELNMDGSHTPAKKGGEAVAYQGRKKAKTSNILPIADGNGYIIATTDIIAGNHNDAYQLQSNLQKTFKEMKQLGLSLEDAFFKADKAFDLKLARKTCFNHGLIPNMPENKLNRKRVKRGRKRLFNRVVPE